MAVGFLDAPLPLALEIDGILLIRSPMGHALIPLPDLTEEAKATSISGVKGSRLSQTQPSPSSVLTTDRSLQRLATRILPREALSESGQ